MRRLLFLIFLAVGCHHESSPTAPDLPYPMGANGDARLSGMVVSFEGEPVPGALVAARMVGVTFDYRAQTDLGGRFRITEMIPHGDYVLSVYLPIRSDAFTRETITLGRFEEKDVRIELPPGTLPAAGCTFVSGHVRENWTTVPIGGAQISFLGLTTTSRADGWYSLQLGCPPAVDHSAYYPMHIEAAGYLSLTLERRIPAWSFVEEVDLLPLGHF